jgi:hypothetical protein
MFNSVSPVVTVLRIEPRVSYMLGKYSTTKLHPQAYIFPFQNVYSLFLFTFIGCSISIVLVSWNRYLCMSVDRHQSVKSCGSVCQSDSPCCKWIGIEQTWASTPLPGASLSQRASFWLITPSHTFYRGNLHVGSMW